MVIAYILLSLLAVVLFGPVGFLIALFAGIGMIISNTKKAKPANKVGAASEAKLSQREIDLREMDIGDKPSVRHLGDKPSAKSAKSDDPWGNKAYRARGAEGSE